MCVSKGWAVYIKCSSQDQVFIGKIYVNSSIPREGGGDIFTYGLGYVIPMVYMSKWLRIFDSGGWGVVCCGWGFLTLGVGFCMLCPINQSAVSYDSHWTTSRLDNGTRRYRPIHGLSVNQAY